MDAIFTNSEKNKTFEPYGLLLNLANKITLKRSDIYVALSNRSMYFTWKNINKKIKKSYKKKQKKKTHTHKLKCQLQHGHLNYPIDHILNQILTLSLSIT